MKNTFLDLYKNDADAARKTGVTAQYISMIRHDQRDITPKIAMAIHRDHGIPLWEILPKRYPKQIFASRKKFGWLGEIFQDLYPLHLFDTHKKLL